ncbi:MAG: hypothetical protein ACON35_02945 [Candidatus Marinamargulisbacteria bacterium]
MPANRNKPSRGLIFINVLSFALLILNLNFNVRTFRLTQELQTLTIALQALEREVELKEINYYTATSLDKVEERAENEFGMFRQRQPLVFSNEQVQLR